MRSPVPKRLSFVWAGFKRGTVTRMVVLPDPPLQWWIHARPVCPWAFIEPCGNGLRR